MDRLLDDVIAREPAVVVPVAHLVLHVGSAFGVSLARVPNSVRVVGRLDRDDVADLAVEHLLHRLAARAVVPPAESVDQTEILGLGVLACLNIFAQTGPVDGHRFLDERVHSLFDGVGQMNGPKMRRRGQDYEIDLVDHVLECVEAGVLAILGNIDAAADLFAFELGDTVVDPIGERVGHGHERCARVSR